MKVQYCYLTDLNQINEERYFLVLPDFSYSKRSDSEAARLLDVIDKAEKASKHDIDNPDYMKQSIISLKEEYNKVVTHPKYLLEKAIFEHMMREVGDAFYLFNDEEELIQYLEYKWREAVGIEQELTFPLKKIYIMSEETGKPIGEFNYKVHKDMV